MRGHFGIVVPGVDTPSNREASAEDRVDASELRMLLS
jgi:hypothetical protein